MTVYDQINNNRWKTYLIIGLFIIILSGFFYLVGKVYNSPISFFILGFTFSLFSSIGSYFYSDKIVILTTGAQPADRKTYFDFYTVAENLAIADGLPKPKIYVIDDPSPNAFATGRDYNHAVVCATTGLLAMMDRAELEGVIAHELSHIKNYDILLSTIVAVLVGTLAMAADIITRTIWWGRGGNRESRNPLFIVLFILSLFLSSIVATLIQMAISRRREYLADASGALLTRYPEGLARALEKIKNFSQPLKRASSSTAHLFISNPFGRQSRSSWLMSLFSTHPPIEERIKILQSM